MSQPSSYAPAANITVGMNFAACLSLPRDPREAALIADNLEALARALRDWPVEAWLKLGVSAEQSRTPEGLFERLARRAVTAATNPTHRAAAEASAEAVAAVLRVLWPEARQGVPAPEPAERVAAPA